MVEDRGVYGCRSGVVLAVLLGCFVPGLVAPAVARDDLPADVAAAIRAEYGAPDAETRYVAGRVDLSGDGKDEVVVHVVGMTACGSGGCTTLVFTPNGTTYRLVATISVSRAPIRAGTTRTHGWRNVIVRVGGGGAKPHDVELAFDGTSYPSNPTVAGPRVTTAKEADAAIVVPDLPSFDAATPLPPEPGAPSAPDADSAPSAGPAPAAPPAAADAPAPVAKATPVAAETRAPVAKPAPVAPPAASGPSFDCAKAAVAVEKLVCRDAGLAALDRTLDAAYVAAMRAWPADEQAKQRSAQRAWMKKRNACADGRDVRTCVAAAYRHRLVEVQIDGGQVEAAKPVVYACAGRTATRLTVAFHRKTEPASAVVTLGDRRAVAFAVPAASGARYVGADVELWEHHGEATVTWAGVKHTCTRR